MSYVSIETLLEAIQPEVLDKKANAGALSLEGLTSDSRKVVDRGAFVAIKGHAADGHAYLGKALDAGARLLVAESFPAGLEEKAALAKCTLIRCANTRRAYALMCFAWFGQPQQQLRVIGITGTNGKTSVATLTWQLLNAAGIQADLLGTAGKNIGGKAIEAKLTTADPFELAADFAAAREAGSQAIVMEASSHALDQHRTDAIDFDVAVFTNLSRDHLDYHGSMQAYAEAKYRLFKNLKPKAVAVINADDTYADMMRKTAAKVVDFSFEGKEAVHQVHLLESQADSTVIKMGHKTLSFRLVGLFNAKNMVAAWLAAQAIGANEAQMEGALPGLVPASGRMELVELQTSDDLPKVIVDYAHTPDAMDNTLAAIHEILSQQQRLVVIFGCGGDRDRGKRPEMAAVAQKYADLVVVTDDNPRTEDPQQIFADIAKGFNPNFSYQLIQDRAKAIAETIKKAQSNDVIMILGKGHETYQEIGGARHHFDDREEARKALESLSQLHVAAKAKEVR